MNRKSSWQPSSYKPLNFANTSRGPSRDRCFVLAPKRSGLAVPIRADNSLQGSINTEQKEPYPPSLIDYKGRTVYHQTAFFDKKITVPRNHLPAGL